MPTSRSGIARFALAMVFASLAGAVAAFIATFVFVFFVGKTSERNLVDASQLGWVVAFWALMICAVYALVVGFGVYAYVRATRRVPSLAVAIIVALLIGAIPFGVASMHNETPPFEALQLFFPILAIVCSIATAWTFWRGALSTH
jgi:amino acid transporter